MSSASYSILPRAVQAFQNRLPLVEVSLNPLTSAEQVSGLLGGSLDLGILRDQGAVPGLRQERVLTERLVIVLPEQHHLAGSKAIEPRQLAGEPMILFPYELMPGYLARVTEALEGDGTSLRVAQRTVHQETVLGLVAAGVGLSALPESVASVRMPGVVSRPICGDPATALNTVWQGELGPAARAFADCVLAAGTEVAGM